MFQIQYGIIEHGIIHIIDGDFDIRTAGGFCCLIFPGIGYLAAHKPRQKLLHNVVCRLGKFRVNRQVNILPCLCLFPFLYGNHLSHIVNDNLLIALGSLQGRFHVGLYAALSHHIIDVVAFRAFSLICHFFIKGGHFIRGNLAGVPQYMGKVLAVHVLSHRILHNADPGQFFGIFHNHSYRFFADIGCHGGSYVFPVGGLVHGIPECHQLQPVLVAVPFSGNKIRFGIFRIFILSYGKACTVFPAQIFHHFLGCRGSLVIL